MTTDLMPLCQLAQDRQDVMDALSLAERGLAAKSSQENMAKRNAYVSEVNRLNGLIHRKFQELGRPSDAEVKRAWVKFRASRQEG